MRLIDADAAIQWVEENECYTDKFKRIMEGVIDKQPTVDAVPVVRCKECKKRYTPWCFAHRHGESEDDFFCKDGERKTDEQQTEGKTR